MKQKLFLCVLILINFRSYGQNTAENPSQTVSFQTLRNNDFTKVVGINTKNEGFNLSYDNTKTELDGTVGKQIPGGSVFLFTGSLGTTANPTVLFTETLPPVFSADIFYNARIPWSWGNRWYYDGQFQSNFSALSSGNTTVSTGDERFSYRKHITTTIKDNKYTSQSVSYTHKKMFWVTLNFKYDNEKYSFFDSDRKLLPKQYDTMYHTFNYKVAISAYAWWNKTDYKWKGIRPGFIYGTIYANYRLINNINQLKKSTINQITKTVIDSSSGTKITQQIIKQQSDYQGKYQEFHSTATGLEVMICPWKDFLFDFLAERNFINGSDKTAYGINDFWNCSLGIFFFGSGDNKSKLNVGFYYTFAQNLSNNGWVQHLGIKTTLPITPL